MKRLTMDSDQVGAIVAITNNLMRAIVDSGGTGLTKHIMDMPVKDFLVLLVNNNNNIAIDATYFGG